MFLAYGIVVLIFIISGVTILGANLGTTVNVWFFGERGPTSVALVMILSFVGGVVLALITAIINELRLRRLLRGKEKEIKRLTEDLGAIRNLPLEEAKSET